MEECDGKGSFKTYSFPNNRFARILFSLVLFDRSIQSQRIGFVSLLTAYSLDQENWSMQKREAIVNCGSSTEGLETLQFCFDNMELL